MADVDMCENWNDINGSSVFGDTYVSDLNVPLPSASMMATVVEVRGSYIPANAPQSSMAEVASGVPDVHHMSNLSRTFSSTRFGTGATADVSPGQPPPSSTSPSGASRTVSAHVVGLPTEVSSLSGVFEPDVVKLLVPKLEKPDMLLEDQACYGRFSMLEGSSPEACCAEPPASNELHASSPDPSSPSSSSALLELANELSDNDITMSTSSPRLQAGNAAVLAWDPLLDKLPLESVPSSALHLQEREQSTKSANGTLTHECVLNTTSHDHLFEGNRTEVLCWSAIPSVDDINCAQSAPPPVPSAEGARRICIDKGHKGTGWPYAPQGWPESDDRWTWRVGQRESNGFHKDRVLGLPASLREGKKQVEFPSKKAVVRYLESRFPLLDVDLFFQAFQWRIPCSTTENGCPDKGRIIPGAAVAAIGEKRQRDPEPREPETDHTKKQCRAENVGLESGVDFTPLSSLALNGEEGCLESRSCVEETCLFCHEFMVRDAGDCFTVRCLQQLSGMDTCNSGAHLECALNLKMAGVVRERGLDMEYLCPCCQGKTDLRDNVTRLLEAIQMTKQKLVAEKSLQLALQILQGTERGGYGAKILESLVQTALKRVRSGVAVQEVFSELRNQGMAAEEAEHRLSSFPHGEDNPQQPEASLDQWLPSCGTPGSHRASRSPSFSSPVIRRNASVNSPAGCSEDSRALHSSAVPSVARGESGECLGYQTQKTVDLPTPSEHGRSHNLDTHQEASCDSQGITENCRLSAVELGSRSMNLRTKFDYTGSAVSKDGQVDEHCRLCGAKKLAQGLDATSSKSQEFLIDGEPKGHFDAGDTHASEKASGGRVPKARYSEARNNCAKRSVSEVMGISMEVLDDQIQQQVTSILQKLKDAQEAEYLRARERLVAQKSLVLKQYELLEVARNEIDAVQIYSPHHLAHFDRTVSQFAQQSAKASKERLIFEEMAAVADKFGTSSSTSKFLDLLSD